MGALSGSRPTGQAPAGLDASRIDPARFGKYGILKLDEYAVEALASAIRAQGAGNITMDRQREMLCHALVAFLIRAQVGGEWEETEINKEK